MSDKYIYYCKHHDGRMCQNSQCPINGKRCPLRGFAQPFPWEYDPAYNGLCKYEELVIDWKAMSYRTDLSDDFICQNKDKLNWSILCKNAKLSESVLSACADFVDWEVFGSHQTISEQMVSKYAHHIDASPNSIEAWRGIATNKDISEAFLRTILHKCGDNIYTVLAHKRELSCDFIRDFQDKFTANNWRTMSSTQPLSMDIIREFAHLLDWHDLFLNGYLSDEDLLSLKSEDEWYEIIEALFYDGNAGHNRQICKKYRYDA